MSDNVTITKKVHFTQRKRGRRQIAPGPKPVPQRAPVGTIPRISRLMALAIRFDGLLRSGMVTNQAELAALGHVSRARVTQIMNLLHLAPDIQEEILFLPRTTKGRDPIRERDIRPILAEIQWPWQRILWGQLKGARQE